MKIGYLQPVRVRRRFSQAFPEDYQIKLVSKQTLREIEERIPPITRYAWLMKGYPVVKIKGKYQQGIPIPRNKTFYYSNKEE